MSRSIQALLPHAARILQGVGENLRLARLRRRLTAKQVAERAGMNVVTLRAIEQGSPHATIGAYTAVMQVLGLESGLAGLAQDDPLGRRLQDAGLTVKLSPKRRRPTPAPKDRKIP